MIIETIQKKLVIAKKLPVGMTGSEPSTPSLKILKIGVSIAAAIGDRILFPDVPVECQYSTEHYNGCSEK